MDAEIQGYRECRRCHELRPVVPAQPWHFNICPQCQTETQDTPKLRKCSKCGYHRKDWESKIPYCPECWRTYQREYRRQKRAEQKANPPPTQSEQRKCSKCGEPHEWPSPGWRDRQCPPCSRAYNREYKRKHPDKRKLAPQGVPGREPYRQCSRCRKRKIYTSGKGWINNVCGACNTASEKKSDAKRKATYAEWRETRPMVKCRTCGLVQQYGKGWDKKRCPECQSARAAARYQRMKANPESLAQRKATQKAQRTARYAEWRANQTPTECNACGQVQPYGKGWNGKRCPQCQSARAKLDYAKLRADPVRWQRRKAKLNAARRKSDSSESTAPGVGMDTGTGKTPEKQLILRTGADSAESQTEQDADAMERKAIAERVRAKLREKGIPAAPLTGKVVVDRGGR